MLCGEAMCEELTAESFLWVKSEYNEPASVMELVDRSLQRSQASAWVQVRSLPLALYEFTA